jgi:sulfoacetaldehyde acetyltransferase
MNEMTACGRDEWPAITMVIFRNYQWGAEKRNTTLWYHDNFVGTELNSKVSYAGIAAACGMDGVRATTMEDLTEKLNSAIKAQMEEGKTTFIEVMTNQELGEPFRRDAMTTPVPIAGIDKADMRHQKDAL